MSRVPIPWEISTFDATAVDLPYLMLKLFWISRVDRRGGTVDMLDRVSDITYDL
jgi:hypothetical protein